jgi:cytochrome c2
MKMFRWIPGLVLISLSTLTYGQSTDNKPADPAAEDYAGLSLFGSVFVTGTTVIEVCGDTGAASNPACDALVMGLFNGFLYGASYGGFVTCVPDDVGSDRIVPLFVDYVRDERTADWDHAGDMMAGLLESQAWGGYDGGACLEPAVQEEAEVDDPSAGGQTAIDLFDQVADADIAAGQSVFGMCSACHSTQDGAPNGIGPTLWNIVDQPVASVEGFPYSAALTELRQTGAVWDLALLSDYLENSMAAIPGTTMMFRGVRDPVDRINLLAYLASLTAE